MESICPQCHGKNRHYARFCDACGTCLPLNPADRPEGRFRDVILAMKRNDARAMKRLIEVEPHIAVVEYEGYTPLHWAAENGYIRLVDTLIRKGADINGKTRDRWIPLDLALCEGHIGVARLIKEYLFTQRRKQEREFLAALKVRNQSTPVNWCEKKADLPRLEKHLAERVNEIVNLTREMMLQRLMYLINEPARRLIGILTPERLKGEER